MKVLRLLVVAMVIASGFSSCQSVPIIFNMIDFKPMSMEDAEAQSRTVVLRNSAKMEFSNNAQPLPMMFKQWDINIFKSWEKGVDYKVETIPAGTKVKILGVVHTETMGFYPFLLAHHTRYLVETPDGRRGTAFIPEAIEGLKVGFHNVPDTTMTISRVRIEKLEGGSGMRFWFKMKEDGKEYTMNEADLRVRGQLPVYHDGPGIFMEQEELNLIKGMTLSEVEDMIAPTFNISREGGRLVAKFPFVHFKDGVNLRSGMDIPLKKKDGELIADGYEFRDPVDFSGMGNLYQNLYSLNSEADNTSIQKHQIKYGYYEHPRFDVWSSFEFQPIARKLFGVVIGLILFLIAFIFAIPLLARLVFYIRPLTNKQVKLLSGFLYIVIYLAVVYYFLIYQDIILLIITIVSVIIAFDALYSDIRRHRCERCHAVDLVEYDGTEHRPTEVTTRETVLKDRRNRRWRFMTFLVKEYWSDHYVCRQCGYHYQTNHSRAYTKTPVIRKRTVKRY